MSAGTEIEKGSRAIDGTRGGMPQAIDQPHGPWPQGLPVFTAEYGDYEAGSGLGERHNLHPATGYKALHGNHLIA